MKASDIFGMLVLGLGVGMVVGLAYTNRLLLTSTAEVLAILLIGAGFGYLGRRF